MKEKPERDPNLLGRRITSWNRKQTVWRAQEYRKAKPLVENLVLQIPFLSILRDQRSLLSQVVGNQVQMKLNYQRYGLFEKGGQAKHTCLLSGRARGTLQGPLVARYTFRRLLRYGTWPGFSKGK
jgi:ribosomal protein S14